MARYSVLLTINTEEDVTTELIEEYVIDVLHTCPFDGADPPTIKTVTKE